jgi:SusD family.
MKQFKRTIIITAMLSAAVASSQSCDVLEINPTTEYSEDVVYASTKNLDLYIKNLYSLLYANADIAQGYVFDDGFTDLVKYSWYVTGGGSVNQFFYEDNKITPQSNMRSNWGYYYNIRHLNDFFQDINKGYTSKIDNEDLKVRAAEVRFLRAYAYQELTLRHGGVILRVGEEGLDGAEQKDKARSSEAECWDFVMNEYTKASADLPEEWSGENRGRITKGAAIGMKARAALYAKRWQDAIDACNELEGLGKYSLIDGANYNSIFSSPYNTELILPVYYQEGTGGGTGKMHNFNYFFAPPQDGFTGASKANAKIGAAGTPTEEYASCFDIKVNGTYETFSWDNLAKYGNKPYANRDPRFYSSILYNDASWNGRNLQLYEGGLDGFMMFKTTGQDNVHTSTTGYIFRKFLSTSSKIDHVDIRSAQYWIEMRLAEIILIKSEAYARLNKFTEAYKELNRIRTRVSLPEKPVQATWGLYLEDLEKERICELGMEGHRYWDLVRWGKAVETLNGKRLHGVKITKNGSDFNYEVVECDVQDRHFPERYTIFPIPYTELKNNTLCKQNDLWL